MRLVMLLVDIFMIYDCHVGHFSVMRGNYYLSFIFNSAKQHSVAQIDGTVELVLSVGVTEINGCCVVLWTPWQ